MLERSKIEELIQKAMDMTEYSYVPYSNYRVGAALLSRSGQIFTGCNIENAAYTPSNCAERTAFFKAVSEGVKTFQAIAIVGKKDGVFQKDISPCGVCRQVMMEFCNPDDFQIIMAAGVQQYEIKSLRELLPMGFGPSNLA